MWQHKKYKINSGVDGKRSVIIYDMKNKDHLIGTKISNLTIKKFITVRKVEVECDCGTIKTCDYQDLKRGRIKGCGCQRNTDILREKSRIRCLEMIGQGIMNRGWQTNSCDEYTPFRYLFKLINGRSRDWRQKNGRKRKLIDNFLSLTDLKTQWEKQRGICPFSNISLMLPTHSEHNLSKPYLYASIDRIDSSLPYQTDNFYFVSRTINYGKHTLSEKEFSDFINLIRHPNHIKKIGNNYYQKDFRYFIKIQKQRMKAGGQKTFLSADYLLQVWEKQRGKCAYSGINLYLNRDIALVRSYEIASIDRIDSTLPYIKGNIQFVSRNINYAKNNLSHDDFVEFLTYLK